MTDLLGYITEGIAALDPQRRERGMSSGRWTSTPVSRRSLVNLDVLVLTDRRTGVLATLMFWAGRVRREHPDRLPRIPAHTITTEAGLLGRYWRWALAQPWASEMLEELSSLADVIHEVRYGVPVRPCPVCTEPVRLDRFVTEHRVCLDGAATMDRMTENPQPQPKPEPEPAPDEREGLRKQSKPTGPARPEV